MFHFEGWSIFFCYSDEKNGQYAYMNGHLTTSVQSRVCRADHNSDGSKEVAICQGKDGEKYECKCG